MVNHGKSAIKWPCSIAKYADKISAAAQLDLHRFPDFNRKSTEINSANPSFPCIVTHSGLPR
jgi:hypothetical protein